MSLEFKKISVAVTWFVDKHEPKLKFRMSKENNERCSGECQRLFFFNPLFLACSSPLAAASFFGKDLGNCDLLASQISEQRTKFKHIQMHIIFISVSVWSQETRRT